MTKTRITNSHTLSQTSKLPFSKARMAQNAALTAKTGRSELNNLVADK
jgi:hypothetical protein